MKSQTSICGMMSHAKKRNVFLSYLIVTMLVVVGCTSAKVGWQTNEYQLMGWIKVIEHDPSPKSGYQRLRDEIGMNSGIGQFVKKNGFPDYLCVKDLSVYEFAYIKEGRVYQVSGSFEAKVNSILYASYRHKLPYEVVSAFETYDQTLSVAHTDTTPTPSADEKKSQDDARIAAEKAKEAERIAVEEAEAKLAESKKIAAENATADEAAKKAAAEGAINVIGLYPGITTEQQVEYAKADYGFIIGGYELLCVPEFKNNKLYSFTCVTGEENISRDRVKGFNELVSNIEVYEQLFKGFSKKFGIPQTADNQVRTKLGVKYVSEIAVWKDKIGNQLSLISIANTTDSGALFLESVEKINAESEAEMKANQKRNF